MRKIGVLSNTIFLSILIAATYGVLHDEVTYSISPEYFTKFKYRQFNLHPDLLGNHRRTVAVIGFLATWWVGLYIGIIIGMTGLIVKDHITMRKMMYRSLAIIFIAVILFGAVGFFWGRYHLTRTGVDWWLPSDLVDKNSFITVGSIHHFGYLGAMAGVVLATGYMIVQRRR